MILRAGALAALAAAVFFCAPSALAQKVERCESPEGKVPVETHIEDYREVDGVKLPHTVPQVLPAFSVTIKVNEIKHNVPIEDAKFDKPASQ